MGARILNYLQDVREFYHALGVGGLEEYIYNVRAPEPYWWAPKDSIRYSAPVVGPLKGPIYNSGTKLGSQNRRTAEPHWWPPRERYIIWAPVLSQSITIPK